MLRKKSERYFKPVSRTPFSTTSNRRNQGWVGQTSLSRSVQPTTYRVIAGSESVAQGHGGCCGVYIEEDNCGLNICTPVVQTGYKARPCGNCNGKKRIKQTVKDFSPLNMSQSQYIEKRRRAYFARKYWGGTSEDGVPRWKCNCAGAKVYHHIGGKLYTNDPYGKDVFYSQGTGMPSLSQGGYIRSKLGNTKCMQNDWPQHVAYNKKRRCTGCGECPDRLWDYKAQMNDCKRQIINYANDE
tara:strand:+ start:25308 stop:26030 length:723 start_codon:yes stop_codon:yes gene_type:complete